LNTLELIIEGLDAELLLIPKDNILAVKALLSEGDFKSRVFHWRVCR